MLWYKSWLETRSRFLIGLLVMMFAAAGTVIAYPKVMQLMPLADTLDTSASGELGRRIKEGVELAREYRGYVWAQWIRQSFVQMGTLFAVLLGSGGLRSHTSGGAALFTLSMPVSRSRVLGIRAATGLAELLALVLLPALLMPLMSPTVGQSYSVADAAVHGACLFVAGAVFFHLALLLSTVFSDLWRPLLIACGVAVVLGLCEAVVRGQWTYGIFRTMSGEDYFRTGHLPWLGLLASTAASAVMLYGATKTLSRKDF